MALSEFISGLPWASFQDSFGVPGRDLQLGSSPGSGHAKGTELMEDNPSYLRTHILRPLGPKTIPYKAFGMF